jgi:hypothetical protein
MLWMDIVLVVSRCLFSEAWRLGFDRCLVLLGGLLLAYASREMSMNEESGGLVGLVCFTCY